MFFFEDFVDISGTAVDLVGKGDDAQTLCSDYCFDNVSYVYIHSVIFNIITEVHTIENAVYVLL